MIPTALKLLSYNEFPNPKIVYCKPFNSCFGTRQSSLASIRYLKNQAADSGGDPPSYVEMMKMKRTDLFFV